MTAKLSPYPRPCRQPVSACSALSGTAATGAARSSLAPSGRPSPGIAHAGVAAFGIAAIQVGLIQLTPIQLIPIQLTPIRLKLTRLVLAKLALIRLALIGFALAGLTLCCLGGAAALGQTPGPAADPASPADAAPVNPPPTQTPPTQAAPPPAEPTATPPASATPANSAAASDAAQANPPQPAPPTVIVNVPDPDAGGLEDTRFAQVARGERVVTLDELLTIGFWADSIRELAVALIALVPRVMVAIVFLIIAYVAYRAARRVVVGSLSRVSVDSSIRELVTVVLKWVIMGFGLVIAFNQVGLPITALLAGVSLIGLAIGFAAQETISNLIAAVVIIWDRPFKVGDWIAIEDTFGEVQRVTFRSTRILNLDGEVVVLPNVTMLSSRLTNHTTHPIQRVNVAVGIAYSADIDKARQVLLGLVKDDPSIEKDPPPRVHVVALGSSSVDLVLRFWIKDESEQNLREWEFLERAKKALDAAGIAIPFPHLQLLLEQTDAVKTLAGRNG